MIRREHFISFLLRAGLAVVFLYAAISSFLSPSSWIGFLPVWLQFSGVLTAFSVFEIILSLWLLSNRKIWYAAIISTLTLFAIIIFNTGALDIIFRDVAILFMALSLTVLHYKKK